MSHSCSSPSQSPVLPSSSLDTQQTQHLENNTPVATCSPTKSNTASPIPQDSDSSSPDNTLSNSASSFSHSIQSSHPSSPSQISFNSTPKFVTSSNSSSMSANQVVATTNNLPLNQQQNRAISPHSFPSAVSPNPLPYNMSCPTGFQLSYDHMYPDSQSSLSPNTPSHALSVASRTPNIYINGLPPNFLESDLFALARPFGEVKSVRSFTRHVSEKPTGYGFVLFNDVDSAERCIEGLRKYRNLHPSFSKQLHRIPGTVYADQNPSLTDQDEGSFKARMEKLKDETSSNLYIEGLPLSIDEESLAALMHPHAIKSNRFFKTKLSEPPRIIAFVRLETRSAAEDTIHRLHGRMVRGLDDPGCRISVRFADSAEQRELRRSERLSKNSDQSPARLTIAQAALLNLRGKEIQSHTRKTQAHRIRDIPNIDQPRDEISQSGAYPSYSGLNLVPPGHVGYPYGRSPSTRYQDLPSNCADDFQLSLRRNPNVADACTGMTLDEENKHRAIQRAHLQPFSNATLYSVNLQPSAQQPRSQIQARNGFTPTEELILQTHAMLREQQHQQLQAQQHLVHPRDCTVSRGASGRPEPGSKLDANAQVFRVEQSPVYSPADPTLTRFIQPKFNGDALAPISEDGLHALSQHQLVNSISPYEHLPTRYQEELHFRGDAENVAFTKPPSRAIEIVAPPKHFNTKPSLQSYRRPQLLSHSHLSLQQSAQVHECPTLTQRPSSSQHVHRHIHQHIDGRSNSLSSSTTTPSTKDNFETSPKNYLHTPEAFQLRSDEPLEHQTDEYPAPKAYAPTSMQKSPYESPYVAQQLSFESGIKSPTLASPALTYSSRTPSTLSPATPFLGSFGGSFSASRDF